MIANADLIERVQHDLARAGETVLGEETRGKISIETEGKTLVGMGDAGSERRENCYGYSFQRREYRRDCCEM